MNPQLYTAASGLIAQERRVEMISNNLANLSTPGYRPVRAFSEVWVGPGGAAGESARVANSGVSLGGSYEVPGPGPTWQTERKMDVALAEHEFLAVDAPGGRRYTRAGNLQITGDGLLVDGSGRAILDAKGKPVKGLSPNAIITAIGTVEDEGAARGKLLVVRDEEGILRPEGGNLRTAQGEDDRLEEVKDPVLRPGWLEMSGVNPLEELVDLIEAQRAFESYQKLITMTMHEVNKKAVNDLLG